MSLQAKIGTTNVVDEPIINYAHDPIVFSFKAKANNGTLKRGLIVAKDAQGDLVAYNRTGSSPENAIVGVVIEELDTTTGDVANVLVHGTVVLKNLLHGNAAATAADTTELAKTGIYAM